MEADITDFVDNRINSNYYKLRANKKWSERNIEFNSCYEKLCNKLQEGQRKELDNLIDIKNSLIGYESEFAYKLGASDTYKIIKTLVNL